MTMRSAELGWAAMGWSDLGWGWALAGSGWLQLAFRITFCIKQASGWLLFLTPFENSSSSSAKSMAALCWRDLENGP